MFISIDGGKNGGAALFDKDGTLLDTYQFAIPSKPRLPDNLHEFKMWVPPKVYTVVAEGPADWVAIGARQHRNTQHMIYGYQIGTAVARCKPKNGVVLVPAHIWKKYYGLGKDKNASWELARDMHPDLIEGALRFKKADGVAEAILIGNYYIEEKL